MMKIQIFLFLFLIGTLAVQPAYSTVEMYDVDIFCPIDSFSFDDQEVIFDAVQMCELEGTILNAGSLDLSALSGATVVQGAVCGNNTILVGGICEGILPLQPSEKKGKSVKQQIIELLEKNKIKLDEKFKQNFPDKLKQNKDKIKNNLNKIVDAIKKNMKLSK